LIVICLSTAFGLPITNSKRDSSFILGSSLNPSTGGEVTIRVPIGGDDSIQGNALNGLTGGDTSTGGLTGEVNVPTRDLTREDGSIDLPTGGLIGEDVIISPPTGKDTREDGSIQGNALNVEINVPTGDLTR
ncbi:6021_t:CDS:1, partial [Ambispora gerdemannii]